MPLPPGRLVRGPPTRTRSTGGATPTRRISGSPALTGTDEPPCRTARPAAPKELNSGAADTRARPEGKPKDALLVHAMCTPRYLCTTCSRELVEQGLFPARRILRLRVRYQAGAHCFSWSCAVSGCGFCVRVSCDSPPAAATVRLTLRSPPPYLGVPLQSAMSLTRAAGRDLRALWSRKRRQGQTIHSSSYLSRSWAGPEGVVVEEAADLAPLHVVVQPQLLHTQDT